MKEPGRRGPALFYLQRFLHALLSPFSISAIRDSKNE
jgi:hypothetical protein